MTDCPEPDPLQVEKERQFRPGTANYFENVFLTYRMPVLRGKYSLAIESGLTLFEKYRASGAADFDQQHKGSPYYVMGYAAFASHDYPAASLMFDAAVAEDLRLSGGGADTPALRFMRLEDRAQEVLASQIVRDIIQSAEDLIRNYNARADARPITLDELRTWFLSPLISSVDAHKRTLITAFISFIAERKYRSRLIDLVANGSREPFFLHLIRGCILLESILKESPRFAGANPGTLDKAVQRVKGSLKMPPGYKLSARSFDADVLRKIGSGMSAGKAVEYAGRCRNTLGHSLSWATPSLDRPTYDLLVELVASACIHAISTTYR